MFISTDGKGQTCELIEVNGIMMIKYHTYGVNKTGFKKTSLKPLDKHLKRLTKGAQANEYLANKGKLKWKF